MTPDELEGSLWRLFRIFGITIDQPAAFVDALRRLYDAYATGDDPALQAARREVLFRETA